MVRGTSDPRHGLHAIAGSANIATRIGGTYADARASAGSFATYEGQLSAGLETGNVHPELPGRLCALPTATAITADSTG